MINSFNYRETETVLWRKFIRTLDNNQCYHLLCSQERWSSDIKSNLSNISLTNITNLQQIAKSLSKSDIGIYPVGRLRLGLSCHTHTASWRSDSVAQQPLTPQWPHNGDLVITTAFLATRRMRYLRSIRLCPHLRRPTSTHRRADHRWRGNP